jgi:sugar phosphate isomerase/epimerase
VVNKKPVFGFVQGRLTEAPPGCLQWFPQDAWEEEFTFAAQLGIAYIELIAEVQHNPDNPLWSSVGIARIKQLVRENGLTLYALCNDFTVENTLLGSAAVLNQSLDLIERGRLLGVERFIMPLFDASELTTQNAGDYIVPLREIADAANDAGMTTCLETIMTGVELVDLLERLDRPYIKAVYDTGNRVAFGHDLAADIRLLGQRIAHVHIKDKNSDNQNVLLGTGLVNFADVFVAINDIAYDGSYTFETQRGSDPLRTASYNMMLVEYFFQEGRV